MTILDYDFHVNLHLNHPMFLRVSGRLGPIVFVYRNGTNFIRKWVKPYDPKTYKQRKQRNNFARLVAAWQQLPEGIRNTWNLHVRRKRSQMSGYNAFIGYNMKRLLAGKTIVLYRSKENTAFRKYLTSKPRNSATDDLIYIYARQLLEKADPYSLVLKQQQVVFKE
ncbi:MAG: hypothetical protein GY754_31510 [bacterium]|nr:hypothetical protein [bacterium]